MLSLEEARVEFYKHFNSCWDYLHRVGEGGMLFEMYIHDARPEFSWMMHAPKPKCINDIPEDLKYGYKKYLKRYVDAICGPQSPKVKYTDEMAIKDYLNNLDCVEKSK